jgi:hypothetical protein
MTRTTQTVKLQGRRVRITTVDGRVSVKPAPELEWKLQAAQCVRLRAMPEYGKLFTFAGSMEAGKRGPQARIQAKATGMEAGEPDLRIYLKGGRCGFIENKAGDGRLRPEQTKRHELLRALGFVVEVVRAATEQEAADKAEAIVRTWLAANDNSQAKAKAA